MGVNRIILASASPRRHQLFKQMGLSPTVRISGIEEQVDPDLSVDMMVQQIATQKALACIRQDSGSLIVAADTIVYFKDRVFGKPAHEKEAVEMLMQLSGNTHSVYTGVSLIDTDRFLSENLDSVYTFFEETKVTFATLTEKEIEYYVASGSPMDKAGAYGIQDDLGSLFVSRIEGDYYNVVGFPLHSFYRHLKTYTPELADIIFDR